MKLILQFVLCSFRCMMFFTHNMQGYRYELWCLARASGIRYCVLSTSYLVYLLLLLHLFTATHTGSNIALMISSIVTDLKIW